jgi:hypothetical protein
VSHRSRRLACLGCLISLACLFPSAAAAQSQFAGTEQSLLVGSSNTATADPAVPRPAIKPCVVPLFSDVAFADFTPKPFAYAPPSGCAGPWSKVVLEADWSITAGNQYDRTANLWIGGANVYFGTTVEPSASAARSWHVERDLTDYAALFQSARTGSADLGNLVNATYTSVLYGTASLVFYPAVGPTAEGALAELSRPADLVIPVSASATGGTIAVTAQSPLSSPLTLPRNVERLALDVVAQSQASDEFWYTCVPDDVAGTLQSCGGTAFRETEVGLDGQPAGVAPVYPWIFTGGIDPFLWGPIPGVQTLGFAPYRVELSPFAGPLSDGGQHTLTLGVVNANDNFSTTAVLLVWLDQGSKEVTGAVTTNTLSATPAPVVTEDLTTAPDGSITGTVSVSASRSFTIAGWVQTSHGTVETEVIQKIGFDNTQSFVIDASTYQQDITQATTISSETVVLSPQGQLVDTRTERWPLSVDIAYVQASNGSAAQTTAIEQELVRDQQSHWGNTLILLDHLDNVVAPTDRLQFDASGNFLGNTGQVSGQNYFSYGLGTCYSLGILARGGVLRSAQDGVDCTPNRP